MAGWNALFHDPAPYQPVATQSAEWNRGAYLVNGLGHCGACHTPRNALGAEQGGSAFLSGAMVDGWEAPALTALSTVGGAVERRRALPLPAPRPQRRSTASPAARWPRWCANWQRCPTPTSAPWPPTSRRSTRHRPQTPQPPQAQQRGRQRGRRAGPAARPRAAHVRQRLRRCHHDGNGPTLLGVNTPLALNSNLTSARPDNLLRTILDGVREPATRDIGFMPAFRDALDDRQIAELAGYMRARFAPQEPAWTDLPAQVARVRAAPAARTALTSRRRHPERAATMPNQRHRIHGDTRHDHRRFRLAQPAARRRARHPDRAPVAARRRPGAGGGARGRPARPVAHRAHHQPAARTRRRRSPRCARALQDGAAPRIAGARRRARQQRRDRARHRASPGCSRPATCRPSRPAA